MRIKNKGKEDSQIINLIKDIHSSDVITRDELNDCIKSNEEIEFTDCDI